MPATRRILSTTALAFTFAIPATSQLLVDEFSYAPGSALTSNGWTQYGTPGTSITVASGPLTFPDYGSSGVANSVGIAQDFSNEAVKRPFATQTTGTVYVSFMLEVTAATSLIGNGRIVQLGPSGMTGGEPGVRIHLNDDGSGFEVAADKTGGFLPFTAGDFAFSTTHLVIVKYEFLTGSGIDDTVSLFVDPALGGSEPAPDIFYPGGQPDATELSEVAIIAREAAGTIFTIDGVRVSTSWSDAVPVELLRFSIEP